MTNLTYMQARFYDPVAGRFLSTNPIGYQGGIGLYVYASNDPVNRIDPNGELDVYIGGGGDKNGTKIVQNYTKSQQGQPGRTVAYFGENQREQATNFINDQISSGNKEPINIIGHSYGAATAVEVAKGVNGTVDTLVGVDPVGKPNIPNTTSAPANVVNVVTVDNRGSSGSVAEAVELAGKVSGGVPDAFEEAQTFLTNDFGHGEFEKAFEQSNVPYPSAKGIVDRTYE